MNLIAVGVLLLKISANLISSESKGIAIICFIYDSDIFYKCYFTTYDFFINDQLILMSLILQKTKKNTLLELI